MTYDIKSIKSESKHILSTATPKPIAIAAIFMILAVIFQFLTTNLTGISNEDYNDFSEKYMEYYTAEEYELALQSLEELLYESSPNAFQSFAALFLCIVQLIVKTGFIIFCVKTCRKSGATAGNLLDGFSIAFKVIIIALVQVVLISLLSLLLVFPGVIVFYSYRAAAYILIDNPEKKPFQCLKESRQLMKGHKKDLFKLDISFIGWFLLSMVPIAGYATIMYSLPYEEISYCLFFDTLRGIDHCRSGAEEAEV